MEQSLRILIVRPSALGDVCRTVAVLASLRRAFPAARIDWVVQDTFVQAIAAHPALNEAIAFPRTLFARWWRSPRVAAGVRKWFGELRERKYDLVFDCQGLGRSGLIAYCTGASRRVGFRHARELGWLGCNVRHALPQEGVPGQGLIHTVDRMLWLLEQEGIETVRDLRLYVADSDTHWWADQLHGWGLEPERYALLAPGARWRSKRWPAGHWSQIITPLLDRGFQRVVLVGSPDEVDHVRSVRSLRHAATDVVIDLSGKTTIGQTMAAIAHAGLVIANDSAPLHMAVGLDRRCIGLFGPTDPALVGPYGRPEAVIRRYHPRPGESINFKERRLGDSLMRFIDPIHVVEKIHELVHDQGPKATPGAPVILEVTPVPAWPITAGSEKLTR